MAFSQHLRPQQDARMPGANLFQLPVDFAAPARRVPIDADDGHVRV